MAGEGTRAAGRLGLASGTDTAGSSGEDEQRARASQQQAQNDLLFVAIHKRLPESAIIQEIQGILDAGAEINAFITLVDVARQKHYACLEKYLIERGGEAAADIANRQSTDTPQPTAGDNDQIGDLQDEQALDTLLLKDGQRYLTEDKMKKLNLQLESGLDVQKVVKALARCGIDVNSMAAVDFAWHYGFYDVVHVLLKSESGFPVRFDEEKLNIPKAKALRRFVEERNKLHTLIKENRLAEIKEYTAMDTSTLYLNSEGASALATAIKHKRFDIYAFLKSKGLSFKNEEEEEQLDELPLLEKDSLKTAMIRDFPQVNKGHILYLISKSRSKNPVENFKEQIEGLYEYLDDIPEVSIVLQVLQYSEYLDIVFDFDNENIKDVNPTASEWTQGTTDYKDGRIYVAAKTDIKSLAGTLAHELTHLVMYILYNNDCNPFDELGNFRHQFDNITDTIGEKLKVVIDSMHGDEYGPIFTIARAFRYPEKEWQAELIVRVPHILAQYSAEGRNVLEKHKEFKLLFDYYNDEEDGGLLYRCKKLIEENFFIKLRKSIQLLNETVGKIDDIIKYDMDFENCSDLNMFLKHEKQVFLVETASTLLSTLYVYDGLIIRNKNYTLQDSFLLPFESYAEKEDDILRLFFSPAGKVLCISFSGKSSKEGLSKALRIFKALLFHKPEKKVILLIQESGKDILENIKSTFKNNYVQLIQQKFTLSHFTKEAQDKLLEREIILQGESIKLNKLIDILDDNAKAIIDTNIIVKLIKDEGIDIGRKPPDTSDLEGAYSNLLQEVDIHIFVDKLLEQESREVYIISGISGANKQDSFINFVISKIEDSNKVPDINNIQSKIKILDVQNFSGHISKNIQVADDQFKMQHFKKICHNSSTLKIYWIRFINDIHDSKLLLQQIYNPEFYVAGKRISLEVAMKRSIVLELTNPDPSERFIISMRQSDDIKKWLQLKPDQETEYEQNIENKKIEFVYLQEGAKSRFPEIVTPNKTIHLLNFKEKHLIWYKTYGSLNNLIEHRANDYKYIEPLIGENNAIKIIRDNKVSIIAGDPGMGKSTITTRLYNTKCLSVSGEEESIIKSHWVIKVNLKDHVQNIKQNSFSELSEITEFLLLADENISDDSLKTFAHNLIRMRLQNDSFVKPLLIVFDGFDEVLDKANRNKIISMLRYFKDDTHAKLCVTTRLHYQKALEGALYTFALKLEPMDDSTIRIFITNTLSNRVSLMLSLDKFTQLFDNSGEEMKKYTDAFLSHMQVVFKNDITKFIGTPLQLFLMLENAVDSYLEWMKDGSNKPDFSYLGIDIWEVYENFVNNKYEYFFKTKVREKEDKLQEEDKNNLDKYHTDLAKSLIIKSEVTESFKNIQDIVLSAGIVRSEGITLGFIHTTFTEFFAAKAFIYWIEKWKTRRQTGLINFEKQKLFFEILLRDLGYRVVRAFMNAKLLKDNIDSFELKTEYYDKNLLILAAEENHVGIAKLVLDNFPNAEVNTGDNGVELLHIAVDSKHLEFVKFLLERGADVNALDICRRSALYMAAQNGCIEIVKFIIHKGADLNILSDYSSTALHEAILTGHLNIVELLLDAGADLDVSLGDQCYKRGLNMAVYSDELEVVKYIIDKGANVNDVDDNGLTALCSAAKSGNLDIMKHLLEKGAQLNVADARGNTALYLAAESGHLDVAQFLIDKGVQVNAKNGKGETALHAAAATGHYEIAKLLIDKGADIKIADRFGKTVLYAAVEGGKLDIVLLLVGKGAAEFNVSFKNGYDTALQIAAIARSLELVGWLVKRGANVNAVDEIGRTSLYYAVKFGNFKLVEWLIENGADVNILKKNDIADALESLDYHAPDRVFQLVKNKVTDIKSIRGVEFWGQYRRP